MNTLSRIITGIILFIFGIYLTFLGISNWWVLMYGIPVTIIGIFIFFNKKEDDIENIKGDKK